MSPEDLQRLRKELACTTRELAVTLGVDPREVSAWEAGEQFPTKKSVNALLSLQAKGPSAIVRVARGKAPSKLTGTARLSDPAFWHLVRKLVEHPALFDDVMKLAEKYPEP